MKIRIKSEQGNILLGTLVLTAIVGTALASYLKLAEFQNRSVVHSQHWNGAIPVAEAGVEEALAHLNKVVNGDRATNGWVFTNNSYYLKRTMEVGKYEVWINTSNQPTVKAIGYVNEPVTGKEVKRTVQVTATKAGSLMRGIIAKESITMVGGGTKIDSFDSENPAWSTDGRYDSAKSHDMGFAGAVTGSISTGGGGVWGYVGTGPNGGFVGNAGDAAWMASTGGLQPGHYAKDLNISFPPVEIPFTTGASALGTGARSTTNFTYLTTQTTSTTYPNPVPAGPITTSITPVTTVNKPITWSGLLTTNTAPTSSTTYPSAGTYIGNVVTRTVVTGNGKKAVTTTYYDYAKITGYSYQTTTYTFNTTTTNATVTSTNYTYHSGNGNYIWPQVSMSGHAEYLVYGNTTPYVPNGVSLAGQARIIIMPGASLKLYSGADLDLKGNGVMNLNQNALSFQVFGLPGCRSIDFGGNAAFTGTIYAPNAHVQMGGGGTDIYDTVGAITARSVGMNGHFNFHYDEMLGRVAGPDLYKVASWNEI